MKRKPSKVSNAYLPLILAVVAAVGMLVGYRIHEGGNHAPLFFTQNSDNGNLGRVEEVIRLLEAKYVEDVDSEKLVDVAIEAIVKELDPHSVYLSKKEVESINNQMNGSYKGLGIETINLNDTLTIINVLKDSPASKAGLSYGDQIVAINDSSIVNDKDPIDALKSFLSMDTIDRYNIEILDISNNRKSIDVIPGKVHVPNVKSFAISDQLGYIKINRFINKTYEDVVKSLESFQKDNIIEQLIIDVRDNPGGYLPEVIKILNQLFIEDKRLLLYTEGIHSRKNEYKSTGRPFYQVNKLAILINENSASASEILAGALQDWDKAVIIGETSYGKGLVQEQFKINNGGALRLTTARYYTPTGRFIQLPYNHDSTTLDTTKFFSKSLERLLLREGGIAPDIRSSKSKQGKQLDLYLDIDLPVEAFTFIRRHQLHQNKNQDYKGSLKEFVDEYQVSFSERFKSIKVPSKKRITSYMRYHIAKQLKQNLLEDKALEEMDDVIQLAKEKLQGKDITELLKSINE